MKSPIMGLILMMSVLTTFSVFAKSAKKEKHPCAADVIKFCSANPDGKLRKVKCLREHQSELSPACSEQIASKVEKRRAAKKEKREAREAKAKAKSKANDSKEKTANP